MHLYLDIETIPGQRPGLREEIAAKITPPGNISKPETIAAWEAEKKPELVEEAYRKTSLDGSVGHICSIAFAIDDGEIDGIGPGMADPHWCAVPWHTEDRWKPDYRHWESIEAERLTMVFAQMTRALQDAANAAVRHPLGPGRGYVTRQRDGSLVDCQAHIDVTVVAHHADFDLRFLFHRAVVLGVPLPRWFPVNARPNHWSPGGPSVFDTMTYWAGYGGRIGQDRLCAALGIERGDDIGGAEVYDRWLAGDGEAIWHHNVADVERLRAIHRRLTFWTPPEPEAEVSEAFYHRTLSWIDDDGSLITAMRRALGEDVCDAVALAERRGHVTIEVLSDPSDSRIRLTENGRRRLRGMPNLFDAREEVLMSNDGRDHV